MSLCFHVISVDTHYMQGGSLTTIQLCQDRNRVNPGISVQITISSDDFPKTEELAIIDQMMTAGRNQKLISLEVTEYQAVADTPF